MNWEERIVSDPNVMVGKPTIKGTRIAVELIFDRLADGWSEADLLESYPRLTHDDIQAAFAYANECFKDGLMFMPDSAVK